MQLALRFRVALCAMLGLASPVMAQQESPVLVELFTSQGCAACPPADALLDRLADRDDVIALALHVDYWDYIGWADSFGKSQFSDRQKGYARARGRASVYTPQMIIGGMDEVKGSAERSVMGTLDEHLSRRNPHGAVRLRLTPEGDDQFEIEAVAHDGLRYAVDVHVVRYIDSERVDIHGGENNGRSVLYRNIVTSWRSLGAWDGSSTFRQRVTAEGDEALVIVIQEQGHGAVLAAARHR
ncbi:MAG: DUF1223 domain-containing protein [Rhodobacteraceae bacterium]|nr:DUF1223 domain-containing protein [Paracoccaceae bacterium]TVR46224.1 MAG: DUF1223 domain-containing protein [Paracoccaceae bacterium]